MGIWNGERRSVSCRVFCRVPLNFGLKRSTPRGSFNGVSGLRAGRGNAWTRMSLQSRMGHELIAPPRHT